MTANLQAPLGLRADGAFTLFGIPLYEGSIAVSEWSEEALASAVRECIVEAGACISSREHLRDVDAFMELGEAFDMDIQERVPNTAWSFWIERLISHTLKGELAQAASVAEARIAAKDSGRFVVGGQTFYQLALRQLQGRAPSAG